LKTLTAKPHVRALLCRLAAGYLGFVYATGRWRLIGVDGMGAYVTHGRPIIACFWHGRMLMMIYAWRWRERRQMLISRHRDGQLIADIIARFGVSTVMGSSSRGGTPAVRELLAILKAGESIGITPDGPRGPRMRAQIGAVRLAQLSGAPLFPVTFGVRPRRMLSSWDRFIVVFPYARGVVIYGEPIEVPRDAGAEQLEGIRALLERRLNEITAEADRLTGHEAIEPAPLRETARHERAS
jgi:lysophospholipid acyltransferase (LPLAT)-like uncharacterized protein